MIKRVLIIQWQSIVQDVGTILCIQQGKFERDLEVDLERFIHVKNAGIEKSVDYTGVCFAPISY